MELRQLRYAVLAAQTRSFSRAAEILGIKQSTLSRRILLLEQRLGVVLFERSTRGVLATAAGGPFLETARRVLEEIDGMMSQAKAVSRGEAGRLAVGFSGSLSAGNLRATLLDYVHRYPGVDMDTVEQGWERLSRGLQSAMVDIAIVSGDGQRPGLRMLSLWSERLLVALPKGHPLTSADRVHWRDLKDETFLLTQHDPGPEIEDLLIARLADPVQRPNIVTRRLSRENVLNMLDARGRVTVVSEASLGAPPASVVTRPIHDGTGQARISYAAYWRGENDNPALARFLTLLRERHPAPDEAGV